MLYRRATPRFVHPMAQPGPRLLDRLLAEVATRHRAKRRKLLYGLAASVVFAVAGPGIAAYAGHDAPRPCRSPRPPTRSPASGRR